MRTRIQQLAHNRTVYYGLLVLLLLGLVAVHTAHFHGRNYRQDETWDVHLAMELIRQDGLVAHVLGMFTELDPTNFLHDIWGIRLRACRTRHTLHGNAVRVPHVGDCVPYRCRFV